MGRSEHAVKRRQRPNSTLQAALIIMLLAVATNASARELRVCADPNNLPFSNQREEGFENRIVQILARDLQASVKYVWWAQRRGNVRNTLQKDLCDLIPGVGTTLEMLATTRPYYRSTYVFVTRADRHLRLDGFDDPQLRRLTIGVQMIGDDFSNTPPAHALTRRGMIDNVRGFMVYGNYAQRNPAREIIDAVAAGRIDVAIVWGPLAGYFSQRSRPPLVLQPVTPAIDGPMLPMVFDISMGVNKTDRELRRQLDDALIRNRAAIVKTLTRFGVPLLDG
jgi:mxaJ protein